MMDAFREHRLRRTARQAVTIGRAIRAGRVRAKMAQAQVPHVEGAALRDVLADVAADAQLVASRSTGRTGARQMCTLPPVIR